MNNIKVDIASIPPVTKNDGVHEFVIRDDKDKAVAYISVTGDTLLVSTEGWSDFTVDNIGDRKPIQQSEVPSL